MKTAVAIFILVGVVDALHFNDASHPDSEDKDTQSLFSNASRPKYLHKIRRGKVGGDVLDRIHNRQHQSLVSNLPRPWHRNKKGKTGRNLLDKSVGIPHGHAQTDMEPDKEKHNDTNWCAGRETRHFCEDNFDVSLPTAQLVVSTFWEDLEWLSKYDGPTQVYVHNRTDVRSHCYGCDKNEEMYIAIRSQEVLEKQNEERKYPIKFFSIPNIGDEAAGYLTYIITNYEDLPDMMMFLHGHECSRHNTFDMLQAVRKVRRCFSKQHGYMDLNDMVDTPICYENFMGRRKLDYGAKLRLDHLKTTWPALFNEEFGKLPKRWCMDPYAQFVVTKERVQAHSKQFYHMMLDAVLEGTTTMEYFWRMLFVPEFA